MLKPYVGLELPLFFRATNFHDYYLRLFRPWLRGRVLEVGAGLGALTGRLIECDITNLVVCEPDPVQAAALKDRFRERIVVVAGGIADVRPESDRFDTIVYTDVLEHIDDDGAEIQTAAARLTLSGSLLIGGPAHQSLYSRFDATIGHRRRYDRRLITQLIHTCPTLTLERFAYFDCVGALLSVGNRWIRRQAMPSATQILVWNNMILPMSRRLDPLFRHSIGKSFVAVARRRS